MFILTNSDQYNKNFNVLNVLIFVLFIDTIVYDNIQATFCPIHIETRFANKSKRCSLEVYLIIRNHYFDISLNAWILMGKVFKENVE